MAENTQPRFHYGYVIVSLGFWIIVIGAMSVATFGVFFEPLLTEFGWTRAVTSGAMSISAIIAGLFNIVTGRLSDRFGPRIVITIGSIFAGSGLILLSRINDVWHLYACFGIIAIGGSGFLIPIISAVTRWFVKRRGMMTSIIVASHGTCEMISPPLARWLIASYGWRNSYIILGITVIVVIALAAQFIRRDPSQMGQLPFGAEAAQQGSPNLQLEGFSLRESINTREFWLLGAILLCLFFGNSFIYTHIVIHATGLGIARISAVNILSIIGGMYIASLNITGNAVDRIGKRTAIVIGFALVSVSFVLLIVAGDLWLLYLIAVIFGYGRGMMIAPCPLLVADIFGLKSLGVITGAIFLGLTIGNAIGPVITGHIFDITGDYFIALISCSAMAVLGIILTFFIRPTIPQRVT